MSVARSPFDIGHYVYKNTFSEQCFSNKFNLDDFLHVVAMSMQIYKSRMYLCIGCLCDNLVWVIFFYEYIVSSCLYLCF